MAHKRIRKFNTKHTYPEQKLDNDLAQAVVTQGGKIVWLRGQCAQNLDDAVSIDSHDPVQQTHKVMQNMRQLIEEAGGKMEHLVKIVVSRLSCAAGETQFGPNARMPAGMLAGVGRSLREQESPGFLPIQR
jgi:hypothetical protein